MWPLKRASGAAAGALLIAVLLAGCAGVRQPARPGADNPRQVTRALNLSGYPPEFQRGFRAGCAAADAGQARSARPAGADQYAVGWNDGYDYCVPRH